jgi:hypothetical protein
LIVPLLGLIPDLDPLPELTILLEEIFAPSLTILLITVGWSVAFCVGAKKRLALFWSSAASEV